MLKKRLIGLAVIIISLLLLTSVAQESPFAVEERGALEEEFAEEIVIIEERAGTTPDSPLYIVDEIIEDITLAVKDGEDQAEYALEVKQEKISEAVLMLEKQKAEETAVALQKAGKVSSIIEKEIGPHLEKLAKENGEYSARILGALEKNTPESWEKVADLIEQQLTAEEKIKLAAELAPKIAEYCEELSYIDYNTMLQDSYCQPENAPEWLREAIEGEIQQREEEAIAEMVEVLTTCVNDPRDCDCSDIPVDKHRQDCEENKALAIRCEFEQDMNACQELEGKPLVPDDVPEYLRPAFESTMSELIAKKQKEMFAKFAPPECVEAGLSTREECESLMREKYGEPPEECEQDGKFIGMEECMDIMIEKYDIPSECIQDGRPIGQDECIAIMASSGKIPMECMEGGSFIGREECEQKMVSGMITTGQIPAACVEGGQFIGREECEARMEAQATDLVAEAMGGGGPPAECMQDGGFIGMEECQQIMQEKFAGGMAPGGFPGGPPDEISEGLESLSIPGFEHLESIVPGSDHVLIVDDGGSHLVSREELQQLLEQAEQAAGQESGHSEAAEQLRDTITQLKEARERVERGEERGEERRKFGEEVSERSVGGAEVGAGAAVEGGAGGEESGEEKSSEESSGSEDDGEIGGESGGGDSGGESSGGDEGGGDGREESSGDSGGGESSE